MCFQVVPHIFVDFFVDLIWQAPLQWTEKSVLIFSVAISHPPSWMSAEAQKRKEHTRVALMFVCLLRSAAPAESIKKHKQRAQVHPTTTTTTTTVIHRYSTQEAKKEEKVEHLIMRYKVPSNIQYNYFVVVIIHHPHQQTIPQHTTVFSSLSK